MHKPTKVVAALALAGLTIIGGVYFRTASGHIERSMIAPEPPPAGSPLVTTPLAEPEAVPESSATVTAPTPQPAFHGQFPSETSDVEQASSVSFEALPSVMSLELAQAKPGITVGDWQRSHPAEKWEKMPYPRCNYCQESSQPSVQDDTNDIRLDEYCAVFTRTWQVSGEEKLIRKAVFIIPAPSPSMDLPGQTDPDTVVKTGCVIGAVYIEARGFEPLANRSDLTKLQDALPNELTNQFGPSIDEVSAIKRLAFDKSVPTWKRDQARIVIKSLRTPADWPNWKSAGIEPWVGALAYLPTFDFQAPIVYQDLADRAHSDDSPEMFDLGIRTAALDEKTSRPLVNIFQNRITPEYPSDPAVRNRVPPANAAQVTAALQAWLAVTKSLSPQRRAGALLAADCALDVTLSQFQDSRSAAARRRFETLGVKIYGSEGYGFNQDGSFIEQARNLDPDGPIGEAIMMMVFSSLTWHDKLVPKGYDLTVDYVIAAGEKYLSKPRNPDLVPRVEYYVASAYCDRVAESEGAGDGDSEYPPPTPEQIKRGIAARPLALKHYRALLAVDKTSKWALDAWLNSWRILAKLELDLHYPSFEL
jgi:hypothetical protein